MRIARIRYGWTAGDGFNNQRSPELFAFARNCAHSIDFATLKLCVASSHYEERDNRVSSSAQGFFRMRDQSAAKRVLWKRAGCAHCSCPIQTSNQRRQSL